MKKIFTLVLFVAAFGFIANAQLVVPYTDVAVEYDGYIDAGVEPWADEWIDIAITKDPAQANDADYTSAFQIFHNNEAIIIAVKVNDDTQDGTAANSYERDNVEIFFCMDGAYTETAYKDGVWQFRAQRVEDEALNEGNGLGYFDGSANVADPLILDDGFMWGTDDTGSEYVWEIAFPISVLDQAGEFDGENFKFDIAVANGVDGARTGQHFWGTNSDLQWNDAQQFTDIKLETGVGVKEVSTKEGTAFVRNNVLKVKDVNGMVKVYSLAGALVKTAVVNGQASIDVSSLKAGMYIVKADNLSAKVIK